MGIITVLLLLFYVGSNNSQSTIKTPEPVTGHQVESVYPNRPEPTPVPTKSRGVASWYDRKVCQERVYGVNCKTANGEIFDDTKFTTACNSNLRLGTHIIIHHLDSSIEVVCNDRGNFKSLGRDFDLSRSAFNALADTNRGIIQVEWEVKPQSGSETE